MKAHMIGNKKYCILETAAGFYVSNKAGDLVYFADTMDACLLWIAGLPRGLK